MGLGVTSSDVDKPFEIQVPDNELGLSAYRQYKYTLGRPELWSYVLLSRWGEERKMVGFRLNFEREWHVAPRSSHWCRDCVESNGFCGGGLG